MELRNACFAYANKPILQNFNLKLPAAGVTALSGPSGCGKTTLLRLLAGLLDLDSGLRQFPRPAECALLFQENRLLPGLTAAEQLAPVLPRGASPLPYLEAVGLAAEQHTRPNALSGGMQRRLALARLLAYAPGKKLLLLDEPFAGVDAERAAAIMTALRQLPAPILLSAHDAASLSLADQVIRLSGPPLQIISPQS